MTMVYGFSGAQIAAGQYGSPQLAAANRAAERDEAELVHHVGTVPAACRCTYPRTITPGEHVALALRMAHRAAIGMIESFAIGVRAHEGRLYDLGPMLDEQRWDPTTVHEHCEAINFAFDAKLIKSHATQTHLVQIIAPLGL